MTHDTHEENSMGSRPSQGIFIGWLALVLIGVIAAFSLFVIGSGALSGFQ